ncbi:hypothetical protein LSH36_256g02054 [Paralvinella palmiformis]|uniref:Uncharacterized protein n=1 Tax=Paralvinella palmiformis TaxID=53620 RepID=A0AAD9JL92_9ANNE|nr:hypothetical protein LSH36_256g02054 [Paralvinella palmiformis]
MAASMLSLSVAEEFLICSQCHHPIDVQRCSPILASTPCPKRMPSKYQQYTSTPCLSREDSSPKERLRNIKQSYTEKAINTDSKYLTTACNMSLLSDRMAQSSVDNPECYLSEDRDLESEDFVSGYSCELPEQLSTALCGTCSLSRQRRQELNLLGDKTNHGSRMSLYFPDRTGFDFDDNRTNDGYHDSSMSHSMNSEDSGACDVDVGLPSSNDCSSHEKKTDPEQETCMKEVSQRLRSLNKSSSIYSYDNSSSYDIIKTPKNQSRSQRSTKLEKKIIKQEIITESQKKKPPGILDDLMEQFNAQKDSVIKINKTAEDRFANVRRHMDCARKYYHELIEQWFWKNIIILEKEQEQNRQDQQKRVETIRTATADVQKYTTNMEQKKEQHTRTGHELTENAKRLSKCVEELMDLTTRLNQVVFITGHCQYLTKEHLGGVIIQRHHGTKCLPRSVLPSKCLWSFDSRGGRTSDYMATGLSLTSSGDVIVTDTGLDMVTVFSKRGRKTLDINTTPGDNPTTAIEFGDVIAVTCGSEVKLYNKDDGIYHCKQLPCSLNHPQGVTTDNHGHLVVSGYCIDIPAVAVYDSKTYLLNEIINGDNRCDQACEDTTGSELDEPTYPVLFSKPWYVAIDKSNNFLISDRDSHTVSVISRRGEVIERIGSLGHKLGKFFQPAGLCTDQQGCVIIADSQNNRVQVLTPDQCTVLCLVDDENDGIECPTDVALDKDGLLYVLQGNGLVRVFQYN